MIVLDTDHISVLQYADSPKSEELQRRLQEHPPDRVATTVVTLEEQLRGWLSLVARYNAVHRQVDYYARLIGLTRFFAEWNVVPFDERAADRFVELRGRGIRISTMDLKIASVSLVNGATLLSRNLRDFRKVPGLVVEDWLSRED